MAKSGRSLLLLLLLAPAGCLAPFAWSDRPTVAEPESQAPDNDAEESLTLAARLLDQGQESAALPHLKTYLRANPDAVMVRAHLAELLFRQGQAVESQQHFEQFVEQAQQMTGSVNQHLIHVHTRLMELATRQDQETAEELHRGMGLLLLVKKWQASPERRDPDSEEQTLMKAVKAFRAVLAEQPHHARAALYLSQCYNLLGQPGPARTAWELAKAHQSTNLLTSAERRTLSETE